MVNKSKTARTGFTIIQYMLITTLVSGMAFGLMPVFQKAYKSVETNKAKQNQGTMNKEGSTAFVDWFKKGGGDKGVLPSDPGPGLGMPDEKTFYAECGSVDLTAEEGRCGGIPGACGLLKDGCWICNHTINMWQWETNPTSCNAYWYKDLLNTCSSKCANAFSKGYLPPFYGAGTVEGYCYICANSGSSMGYWYRELAGSACTSYWNNPYGCFGSDEKFETPCGSCVGLPPVQGFYHEKIQNGTDSCWVCHKNTDKYQWINTNVASICIEAWENVTGTCPDLTALVPNTDYPYCGCQSAPPIRGATGIADARTALQIAGKPVPASLATGQCYTCGGTWLKQTNQAVCNDFWLNNICKGVPPKTPPPCNGSVEPVGDPGTGKCWLCTNPYENYKPNQLSGDPLYTLYESPCDVYWVDEDYPKFLTVPGSNINTACAAPFSKLNSAKPGIDIDPNTHKWGCWLCNSKNLKQWARLEWEGTRFSALGTQSCTNNSQCTAPNTCINSHCTTTANEMKYRACNDFWMTGTYPEWYDLAPPDEGVAYAWGRNTSGMLGDGTGTDRYSPVEVKETLFKQVSAGDLSSCGIDSQGKAWCWGNNAHGELGTKAVGGSYSTPQSVTGNHSFTQITTSKEGHTCAIDTAGQAWCWGLDNYGELGAGSPVPKTRSITKVIGGHNFIEISTGDHHTCAIDTEGTAWCWGYNQYGKLGNNEGTQAYLPTAVVGGHKFTTITSGRYVSCAIDTEGKGWCWGNNSSGELGISSTSPASSYTPMQLSNGGQGALYDIDAGASSTCAVNSAGRAYCWGLANSGLMGLGTEGGGLPQTVPKAVPMPTTNKPIKQISIASMHVLAISGKGGPLALRTIGKRMFVAWGSNFDGQLGDNTVVSRTAPVPVNTGGFNFVKIAAGGLNSCALTDEGNRYCWGNNSSSQLSSNFTGAYSPIPVKASGSPATEIYVGNGHLCYKDTSNSPGTWCWGKNDHSQTGNILHPGDSVITSPDSGFSYMSTVSLGSNFSCAIGTMEDPNKVRCWGENTFGQIGRDSSGADVVSPSVVSDTHKFTQIAAGETHTCGIDDSGEVWCWGNGADGQLGSGDLQSFAPVKVKKEMGYPSAPGSFTQITVGMGYTCGVDNAGDGWCWGVNFGGQLGSNYSDTYPPANTSYPAKVTGGHKWKKIVSMAGWGSTCGIDTGGDAWCWGGNTAGQLGNGTIDSGELVPHATPIKVVGNYYFEDIVCGRLHCVGMVIDKQGTMQLGTQTVLSAKQVYGWGTNKYGQLGDGTTTTPRPSPTKALQTNVNLKDAKMVTSGTMHTCALTKEGYAACWGLNSSGQLGRGTKENQAYSTPAYISDYTSFIFKQIEAGANFTCGLNIDGYMYCWGYNPYGEFGNNATNNACYSPAMCGICGMAKQFKQIAAGAYHMCGIGVDDKTYCWGANSHGTVGDGTTEPKYGPTEVLGGHTFTQITAASYGNCAIDVDGKAWCWGDNSLGVLGVPYVTDDQTEPAEVAGGHAFTRISMTGKHTCAIEKTTGKAWCWGKSVNGSLGIYVADETNMVTLPVEVTGGHVFKDISAGNSFTCAIDTEDNGWCWGSNDDGRLGIGTVTSTLNYIPQQLPGKYTQIQASWLSSSAIASLPETVTNVFTPDTPLEMQAGAAYGWGFNGYGQVGDKTKENKLSPVDLKKTFIDISAGTLHSCAIDKSGNAWCWGNNSNGQAGQNSIFYSSLTVPTRIATSGLISYNYVFKKISAGGYHTSALDTSGDVWSWGSNLFGQFGDGIVLDNSFTPMKTSGYATFVDVAAGSYHSCAIDNKGETWCWGSNIAGELGTGNNEEKHVPTKVVGDHIFQAISASGNSTCALDTAGKAWCWGNNFNGQLGINSSGATSHQNAPQAVRTDLATPSPSLLDYIQISVASEHTCALDTAGNIWCWGDNDYGQLGNDSTTDSTVPTKVAGGYTFKEVETGVMYSCGITTEGEGYCWGFGSSGQLGIGYSAFIMKVPTKVLGGPYLHISAENQTLAIADPSVTPSGSTASGKALGWGSNNAGQLGNGTTNTPKTTPTPVTSTKNFVQVSAGQLFGCGIDEDGVAWCWGQNSFGQLGNTTTQSSYVPTKVFGGHIFKQIEARGTYACAIDTSGQAWCWGRNSTGVLGDNTITDRDKPTKVYGNHKFTKITLGSNSFICALDTAGKAWCWGNNADGQLGTGKPNNWDNGPRIPEPVAGNRKFLDITAGSDHVCAINTLNQVWCWGDNQVGELAQDLSITSSRIPVPITTVYVHNQISSYGYTTCVLTIEGDLRCWGLNSYGQISTCNKGTTTGNACSIDSECDGGEKCWSNTCTPICNNVFTFGGGRYKQVSVGQYHVCAITVDDKLECWGDNDNGQLGEGNTTSHSWTGNPVITGNFLQVSAGFAETLAISTDKVTDTPTTPETPTGAYSTLYGWGTNAHGQLGVGTADNNINPTPQNYTTIHDFVKIATYATHSCGLRRGLYGYDDTIWCWGDNSNGQLTGSTSGDQLTPILADDSDKRPIDVAVGEGHTLVLDKFGKVWCRGYNLLGQCGQGHNNYIDGTLKVNAIPSIKQVTAGNLHSCALETSGKAWCWGYSNEGQVGQGGVSVHHINSPVPVWGNHTFTQLSGGAYETCGLDTAGQAWCWGDNPYGELGDGTTNPSNIPVKVAGVHQFKEIDVGLRAVCALDLAGKAWCWGYNENKQLGDGTINNRTHPVEIKNVPVFKQISVGAYNACALDINNKIWCWGSFSGTGNPSNTGTPMQINSTKDFTYVAVGGNNAMGMSAYSGPPEEPEPIPPGNWLQEVYTKIYEYGGPSNEEGRAIVEVGNDVYIAGYEASDNGLGAGTIDMVFAVVAKAEGTVSRKIQLGGSDSDVANSIDVSTDGWAYITGYETSTAAGGGRDLVVIKINSAGTIQWKKEFGGAGNEEGNDIAVSTDNQYVYVTGYEESDSNGGQQDISVMKLNSSNGTVVWNKQFGGTDNEAGQSISVLNDESGDWIFVAGWQRSSASDSNNTDAFVMKFDSDGNIGTSGWIKQFGGIGEERALALETSDTSVYVTGYESSDTGSSTLNSEDAFVMRLSYETGEVMWKKQCGGALQERGLGLALSGQYIYVTGYENSITNGEYDIFAIRLLNEDGSVEWANHAGGTGNEQGIGAIVSAEDRLFMTGNESSDANGGSSSLDILLMRVNTVQATSNMSGWTANPKNITEWNMSATDIETGWTEKGSDINSGWESGDWAGTSQNVTAWPMEGTTIDTEVVAW